MKNFTSTRRALAFGAAAFAIAPSTFAAEAEEPYPYPRIGQAAPAFTCPRLGGGSAQSADYRGKTLILGFGGLWCPDCIIEEQELARLARLAATDHHFAFLSLQCGDRFGRWGVREASVAAASAAANGYRAEMNVDYPLAFDIDMSTAHAFAMEWYPTIIIIDRHGIMRGASTDLRSRTPEIFFGQAQAIAAQG